MRIDSHHHFWKYDPAQYGWISEQMGVLRRDYGVAELRPLMEAAKINGVVSVQARQTVEETEWLLEIAKQNREVWGVVGWVPLADDEEELRVLMDRLSQQPLLKGVRHVVHDEPDDRFILRSDFNHGVALMRMYDLVYDILIFAKHLPASISMVDAHPDQRFVVDHIAKPTIFAEKFDTDWANNLRELAKREHVACKFSGVVTEVRDKEWTVDVIRPYWEVALEAFGPSRLMYGSDWPVCLLRAPYDQWISAVETLVSELSDAEQQQFWAGTAMKWYKLNQR